MKPRTRRTLSTPVTVNPTLKSHAQDPRVQTKLAEAVAIMGQVKQAEK